ncbi:polysaccharide lyase family protein [Rathayibacter sp. CAU 1779]
MELGKQGLSRRSALGLFGAATAGAIAANTAAVSAAHAAGDPRPGHGDVTVTIAGRPAMVGDYVFPDQVPSLVLDNGLVTFTFGRDDAEGGVVTGWTDTSITATSVVVDGTELAHNLNGVDPRDPDRQHSFYIDAGGGKTRLVCTQVRVLRVSRDLVEVAFLDTTSTPLQHEHHLIMRRGKRGLYGYDILTASAATSINEVRMNARWDRSILDNAYNWERGGGKQPTYAYLATQEQVQDETWRVDGVNNPNLPSPDDNSGNLPAGYVYTKYNWSLYHHENPMFGHYGHGFGAWLTPLGGVTEDTLCAFYGVGPDHQDLAIHQDALILNYFGANHYGLPSYALQQGYRRLYGPWYTHLSTGETDDEVIANATAAARTEIAENRAGASWIIDGLYPDPGARSTVTGRLRLADGRPADGFYVLLSTQTATDVYTIHEPTYWVKTDADGSFSLPGIPPAWAPGTTTPASYTLYAFASKGSVVEQYQQTGVSVSGKRTDLGTITWAPTNRSTFLWQIGRSDRSTQEFALATKSPVHSEPRAYEKPGEVPGTLAFAVGESWEPTDWYYAQTQGGAWTVSFSLDRVPSGTAYLTVATPMQQGARPTVAVNGDTSVITGSLPNNNDSTIARQADRSGYPRTAVLTFPASALVVGSNTITFTRGSGTAAGNGLGWDTILLEVDEGGSDGKAVLAATAELVEKGGNSKGTWKVTIHNRGTAAANDVRFDSVQWRADGRVQVRGLPPVTGRDPNKFPVPIAASIPPGGSATAEIGVDASGVLGGIGSGVQIAVSANGGRAVTDVTAKNGPGA